MTAWDELPQEESKQYDYLPEGYYDLDTKKLRLVARRPDGGLVFRQVRRAE
jgi:hypothetical protein